MIEIKSKLNITFPILKSENHNTMNLILLITIFFDKF